MVGEIWTMDEKLRLKELHIDPVRSSPEKLKKMVNYFRTPNASVFAITEGHGPLHVSKSLARKVRDYQDEGALDWLMDETPGRTAQSFDPEWRDWSLSNATNFSIAVDAYRQELSLKLQSVEVHLGLRNTFKPMPRRVSYGPIHQPFIESIFNRDQELTDIRAEFNSAIGNRDISKAKILSDKIGERLVRRIAI